MKRRGRQVKQQTLQDPLSTPPPPSPRDLSREIGKALAIVFGGTLLLAIVQWVAPFTAGFMQVGLALILLEVPLRLQGARDAPLYLRIGPIRRGLSLGLRTILLVFPLFVVGFHLVYTGLLERPVDWDVTRLARWSEDLEYAPPGACAKDVASVWTQEDQLWIVPPRGARLELVLTTDAPPRLSRRIRCGAPGASSGQVAAPGPHIGTPLHPDGDGVYRAPPGQGAFFDLGTATRFELTLADEHGPLAEDRIRLGAHATTASEPGQVEDSRGYLWLLAYILIHLGLVAYPEEFFFRGYLLPRLDQRLGAPRRLLGVSIGWGLVLSSLAFALLHPILIPGPHRLLVFFPALLFGWLAARQKELGAAILVHAFSNVLLAIVSRMYG